MDLIDVSKIHSHKSQEYIREVLSSYYNGNYRSAIVMLYSVCLCDLYYKLIELRDVYSDHFSRDLLKKIENKIASDKVSPAWETEMVDSLFKNSPILDTQSYATICHLRDFRNLSAHPVLDDYSELFMPSKEIVEAYIKEAYNTILSKPALLVSNAVEVISEDLDEKKGYLLDDKNGFENYVKSKYLNRMPEAMLKLIFKSFWKFTFLLDDAKCKANRLINVYFLQTIYRFNKGIIEAGIESEAEKYEVQEHDDTIMMAFWLCGIEPELYKKLPDVTKKLMEKYTHQDNFYKFISWFTCDNKEEYINRRIEEGSILFPTEELRIKFVLDCFKETNDLQHLFRYFITIVDKAYSYKLAEMRINTYIIPYLSEMSKENLERIIECFNNNRQVNENFSKKYFCERVWDYAKDYFDEKYIEDHYPNFVIPIIYKLPTEIEPQSN